MSPTQTDLDEMQADEQALKSLRQQMDVLIEKRDEFQAEIDLLAQDRDVIYNRIRKRAAKYA